MKTTLEIIPLKPSSDGVKAPSFGTGEAQYLNPITGQMDVTLATEQRMRHAFEETIFDAQSKIPDALVKDIPFVLLKGDRVKTFDCSSRELSHRIADSQILAGLVATSKALDKELQKKKFRTDLIAQYLDPLSLIGGYWFSYWGTRIENTTAASASLFESTIVARNCTSRLAGSTKFSRFKSSEETLKHFGKKKPSDMGFGMIPAGESQNRFATEKVELRISDVRYNGFQRMRARGVHESTIELLDAVLDLLIANMKSEDSIHLRSRCTLIPENPTPVSQELKNRVSNAIQSYLSQRNNNFGNDPKCSEIKEFFDSVPTLDDENKDKRPNAIVWKSDAHAQEDSTKE